MNRTIVVTAAENQTAVPSRICRIVLNYIPLCDGTPHFLCGYHPLRSEHLPYRVGQIKHSVACRRTYTNEDVARNQHIAIVLI